MQLYDGIGRCIFIRKVSDAEKGIMVHDGRLTGEREVTLTSKRNINAWSEHVTLSVNV